MTVILNKRKKVKVCYERLGLLLLGGITTVIVLNGPPKAAVEELDQPKITFDINDDGVVVILDIANTGTGSLANFMISNAILEPPCQCQNGLTKYQCLNKHGQPWLFHAFNTTGCVCGEHADFATLTNCPIDYWFRTSGRDTRISRQYLLVTMIRDPVTRYVSQWRSLTQEDMFFRNEPRLFRNQSVELQKKGVACYVGKMLSALSLQEFVNCSTNGAVNLQTRMLANKTFVDSLGLTGKAYQEAMLNSAKRTLELLPFFGLYDRPNDSLKLLESTLGLQFKEPLILEDPAIQDVFPLPTPLQHPILQANNLDLKLFQHARILFQERVKAIRFTNPSSPAISSKRLADNYKVVYQHDLVDKVKARSVPDITFDGKLEGSVLEEEKRNMDEDTDEDGEDKYDTDSKQGLYSPKIPHMEMNEDSDEKDTDIKEKEYTDGDESVMQGEVDIVPGFSESRAELEDESVDYKPDVEDVSVFLSRLDRIKQQQKEKDFIQSQTYLQQQKPVPQNPERSPQIQQSLQKPFQLQQQLMQKQAQLKPGIVLNFKQNNMEKINRPSQHEHTFLGRENLPNRNSIFFPREAKIFQPYIITDRTNILAPKGTKNSRDKGLNRMFH